MLLRAGPRWTLGGTSSEYPIYIGLGARLPSFACALLPRRGPVVPPGSGRVLTPAELGPGRDSIDDLVLTPVELRPPSQHLIKPSSSSIYVLRLIYSTF